MAGLGRWLNNLLGGAKDDPTAPPPPEPIHTGTWSRSMMMGTDVATLMIFHPDDMGHAVDWPLGWYTEGPVWRSESAAGRLVAWSTRSDGGWKLRLTDGDLTEAERAVAGPSWTFPLTSNGRVLVDNSDHLPADSEPVRAPPPEAWIDLPEGDWHVTVTAVEWDAAPGADDPNVDTLPNYVICFAPAQGPAPVIARRPPDLVCQQDAVPLDAEIVGGPVGTFQNWQLNRGRAVDFAQPMAAGLSQSVGVTGDHFTSQGESDLGQAVAEGADSFALFDVPVFLAPVIEPGAVGQVCRANGAGGAPNKPSRYSLQALGPARITRIGGVMQKGTVIETALADVSAPAGYQAPLASVMVEPIVVDATPPDDIDPAVFHAALMAALEPDGKLGQVFSASLAAYHRIDLEESPNLATMGGFVHCHLPMTVTERLELVTTDLTPRLHRLLALLSD